MTCTRRAPPQQPPPAPGRKTGLTLAITISAPTKSLRTCRTCTSADPEYSLSSQRERQNHLPEGGRPHSAALVDTKAAATKATE